jgi:hypothetical protein
MDEHGKAGQARKKNRHRNSPDPNLVQTGV